MLNKFIVTSSMLAATKYLVSSNYLHPNSLMGIALTSQWLFVAPEPGKWFLSIDNYAHKALIGFNYYLAGATFTKGLEKLVQYESANSYAYIIPGAIAAVITNYFLQKADTSFLNIVAVKGVWAVGVIATIGLLADTASAATIDDQNELASPPLVDDFLNTDIHADFNSAV